MYTIDYLTHYILQNYFQVLLHGTVNLTFFSGLSVANDATQALFQPFNIFGEKLGGVDPVPGRGVG